MEDKSLTFISPAILKRLEDGAFVPARRSMPDSQSRERRNVISPLSITKRCIRYEPKVFQHRKPQLLDFAAALNAPKQKIFLVGGPQGSGKTSLVRGLIEMMGSRAEDLGGTDRPRQRQAQLLWFDVTRHTDFEEIIQFLIQYITYVCLTAGEQPTADAFKTASEPAGGKTTGASGAPKSALFEEPIRKLEALIRQVKDMPLLIVLDNTEYIVDTELRFNSYPFKEMLNFLLGFPNIKMVLIGERLPYADMSPNQGGVKDIKLGGLQEADAIAHLESRKATAATEDPGVLELAGNAAEAERLSLHALYHKTDGHPWLLKVLHYLNQQGRLDFATLNRLLEAGQEDKKALLSRMVRLIYERLPDQHRKIFQVLALIRHPANAKSLAALVSVCYPTLGDATLEAEALADILEHSALRPLLKISYPPQEVLEHVRHREAHARGERKFRPWYELYHIVKRMLYHSLPQEERDRLHTILQDCCLRDKNLELPNRLLPMNGRALLAEARFHGNSARSRKTAAPTGVGGERIAFGNRGEPQAYRFDPVKPVVQPLTLEDYRKIELPTAEVLGDEAENSLEGPSLLELANSEPARFENILADVALSDEEKGLLSGDPAASRSATGSSVTPGGSALPVPARSDSSERGRPIHLPRTSSNDAEDAFLAALMSEPDNSPGQSNGPGLEPTFAEQAARSSKGTTTGEPADSQIKQTEQPEKTGADASSQAKPSSGEPSDFKTLLSEPDADEREQDIKRKLAAAVAARDKRQMLGELLELARYRAGHGRYGDAEQCLEKALNLKEDADRETLAELYHLNGAVHKETFRHNAAMASLQQAAQYIRRLMYEDETVGTVWLGRLGQVFQDMGEIHAYRQHFSEASDAFNQALRWYNSAGDETRQAEVHFRMAGVYDTQGDAEKAMACYEKALALDEANGNTISAAASLANLGTLHFEGGRNARALECLQRAVALDRESGNLEGQLNSMELMVEIYLRANIPDKAENLARHALALSLPEGHNLWKATFYVKLAHLAALKQDRRQALQYYQLARSTGEQELSHASLRWLDKKIAEVGK